MDNTSVKRQVSDGVLSVLPLIYVGWSDSVLSPSEMKMIEGEINQLPFLSHDDKTYLIQWTNPAEPPTVQIFKDWLRQIRTKSNQLDETEKKNLINLCMKIGSAGSGSGEVSEKAREALIKLEKALAIDNPVSARILLDQITDQKDDHVGSFSSHLLKELLDGDNAELNDRIRELLRDPFFELSVNPDKEQYRQRVLKQLIILAEQGLSGYSFPKKYGGGERKGDHIAVFEMLAYGDLSLTVKFGVQFGLFGGALYHLGTEKHHRKYLEPMHRGQLLGCFAMTETGHGSNVKGLETTATYDEQSDSLIIHSPNRAAGKEYIGNALHATMAVVFAQLIVQNVNYGVHAVLVPMRDTKSNLLPGIEVMDSGYKMGLNGVDNGRIWFDQVQVPRENLLNRYGDIDASGEYSSPIESDSSRFFTMLGALVLGRISVGLASVSATKKALTIAIKYALRRRQFAPKEGQKETLIMDYPSHMERLIPALAHTYAYHFALHDLADLHIGDSGEHSRKIETLAAGLKSKASWHATETIQVCREACGGKGYLSENQLDRLKADTDIFTTFEGDNTVLMQLVAKGVLTTFKQSFHDDGSLAVIKFLLRKASYKVQEYNYLQKRNTDFRHLTSIDFISEAMNYRYEKSLIKLSERMRKYLSRKIDPYQAFLRTQIHMIDLADAYLDKVTLDAFVKATLDVDPSLRPVVNRLITLFGLDTIYKNRGWFLENDFMEGSKSKAIRRVRAKLIQDLRPDVLNLVDAFGIPDELIAAPIALDTYGS